MTRLRADDENERNEPIRGDQRYPRSCFCYSQVILCRELDGSQMPAIGFRNDFLLRMIAVSFVVAVLAVHECSVNSASAAGKSKFNNVLAIGDKAPEWENLPGVD